MSGEGGRSAGSAARAAPAAGRSSRCDQLIAGSARERRAVFAGADTDEKERRPRGGQDRTMKALLGCLTVHCVLTGVSALKKRSHHFPSHVILGRSMNLTCDYDVEGDELYQVKWYKDSNEFFTYIPGKPARVFDHSGVNVSNIDMLKSGAKSVVIHNVDRRMEGMYRCEGTVESTFDTVVSDGYVAVVELPEKGPMIKGDFQDSMSEGDRVSVNCTSYRSRPAAQLTWYINGASVSVLTWHTNGARSDNGSLRWYPEEVEMSGLSTVTLGLDFRLRGSHFGPTGHVTLKCTAEIESVFYSSADISITSRTMAMRSRFAAASSLGSGQMTTRLMLLLPVLRHLVGG